MAKGKRGKSAFDSKFSGLQGMTDRKVANRQERKVAEQMPLLSINFKDFDRNQCPPGQDFEDWQKSGRLKDLMNKFVDVCQCTVVEAQQLKMLKIYGRFPENSDFKIPAHIEGEVQWGTLQRIGGQKPRLAGYIDGSVFYAVFLDENHRFYPSGK